MAGPVAQPGGESLGICKRQDGPAYVSRRQPTRGIEELGQGSSFSQRAVVRPAMAPLVAFPFLAGWLSLRDKGGKGQE